MTREEQIINSTVKLFDFANIHALDEVLEETLNEVEKLTGSLIGFYHFVDEDQKSLTLQNWSTRTKREFCKAEGKGRHYNISEAGVWVDCVREKKPVIHNDYESLPNKRGMPQGHARVIRELVVPVMRGDKIVAILGVGNKPTLYDESDSKLVSMFANVAWGITALKRSEEELNKKLNELETNSKSLEKMNKLMVGRELVMVELKKKIKELEGKG